MTVDALKIGAVVSTPRGLGSYAGLRRGREGAKLVLWILVRFGEVDIVTGDGLLIAYPMEQVRALVYEELSV